MRADLRKAFWFACGNSLLLMLLGALYLRVAPLPTTPLAGLFLCIAYIGHFLTLALPIFLLLALVICWRPRKTILISASVTIGLLTLLSLTIDAVIFSMFRFHFNGMIWGLITSGVANEVLSLTASTWLSFGGVAVVFTLLEWGLARWLWQAQRTPRPTLAVVAMLLLISGGHALHAWADFTGERAITRVVRSLPAYYPLTAKRFMKRLGFPPAESRPELRAAQTASALAYPAAPLTFAPTGAPARNLLIIVIDSWRFDMLTPEVTPNLARFAEQSRVYANHHSGGNTTRFGIFSLMYGLSGNYWFSFLAEERPPLLLQELQRRDYRMGIFGSAPLNWPEFDRTVFANVRQQIHPMPDTKRVLTKDEEITRATIAFLKAQQAERPFFGFMFYDAPHAKDYHPDVTPFRPFAESLDYIGLAASTGREPFVNRYKNSLHYVDQLVAQVLDTLAQQGLLDTTAVLITGDHGEEFNDLGLDYWGHNGNFSRYQTGTPLIYRLPGQTAGRFEHHTAGYDVVPTLLRDLFACTTPARDYSTGRPLDDSSPRPYLLLSTWEGYALLEPQRQVTFLASNQGGIEAVDDRYRELPNVTIDPLHIKSAIDEMSRFQQR